MGPDGFRCIRPCSVGFRWLCGSRSPTYGVQPLPTPPVSPTEHSNYFGVDEKLGPVAVSIRRERLEEPKDTAPQFQFRIIFRTSEVGPAGGPQPH